MSGLSTKTLGAFSSTERTKAHGLLAACVAHMMGRKLEENDWTSVYCGAKGIPNQGWSNLHIDVMHNGLGVEHKMLRVQNEPGLLSYCGTWLMHPALTRSIRLDSVDGSPSTAMKLVFKQYSDLVEQRRLKVAKTSASGKADLRTGWLIWESTLTEVLYFEEPMEAPDPKDYWAEWNARGARGIRKPSKNLWIYERGSNQKRYSVTTQAGIKIQPYFRVPAPNDPNLVYLRVQGEPLSGGHVRIWVTTSTAREIERLIGSLAPGPISKRILQVGVLAKSAGKVTPDAAGLAEALIITRRAYDLLVEAWPGVSDEHRAQLFLRSMRSEKARDEKS